MKKRVFALLLAACIAVGLMLQFPVAAHAAESIPMPTATVEYKGSKTFEGYSMSEGNLVKRDIDFTMVFTLDPTSEPQLDEYKDWYADYELTVSRDVFGCDGFLAGQYGTYPWIFADLPESMANEIVFPAGVPVRIMETLAGNPQKFSDIYYSVKQFYCGLTFDEKFWTRPGNEDATVQLALKLYPPKGHPDEGTSFVVGDNYVFVKDATKPHICQVSGWQKTATNHYKKQCAYANCPLKGDTKYFDMGAHTFGADNFCTVCGYLRGDETAPPKTGDTTHTLLWATLFVGGVAMMWMQLNARKREMF